MFSKLTTRAVSVKLYRARLESKTLVLELKTLSYVSLRMRFEV